MWLFKRVVSWDSCNAKFANSMSSFKIIVYSILWCLFGAVRKVLALSAGLKKAADQRQHYWVTMKSYLPAMYLLKSSNFRASYRLPQQCTHKSITLKPYNKSKNLITDQFFFLKTGIKKMISVIFNVQSLSKVLPLVITPRNVEFTL